MNWSKSSLKQEQYLWLTGRNIPENSLQHLRFSIREEQGYVTQLYCVNYRCSEVQTQIEFKQSTILITILNNIIFLKLCSLQSWNEILVFCDIAPLNTTFKKHD